uniref:Ig-like domain-containing protein n=1 Tax=Plectus sambesii TaxID=2011161 RepID=A0A914V8Z7_9BILA
MWLVLIWCELNEQASFKGGDARPSENSEECRIARIGPVWCSSLSLRVKCSYLRAFIAIAPRHIPLSHSLATNVFARAHARSDQSPKTEVVQVGAGEPFKMQCIVTGEHHENHDLSWSKDGNELVTSDTLIVADSPPGSSLSKTIVVRGFNSDSHVGSYECSVKRKDNTYQSKKMRLQKKLGNPQIADGFAACPIEKAAACLNGGICMMHKASESVSCLCLSENAGRHCEYIDMDTSRVPPSAQASMAAMGFALLSLTGILIFAAFVISKQKRKIKSIVDPCGKRHANEPSQYGDVEMSLLSMDRDQPDGGILKKKFFAIETSDTAQFCWNCGYSQVLINGSYQKRPSIAQITRLPGSIRGSLSGSTHRTPSFRGPANKDVVEAGHGAMLNAPTNGLMRVASLPTTPSAMGPFFEDFDRHCPDCLAQLRAHYYPDSPDMYDAPPFDGLPNGHHQFDHHSQVKDVKKPAAAALHFLSDDVSVRPTRLDLNGKTRSRLPGVSDERLDASPRDIRQAASSPSSPKAPRRMTLTNEQSHHLHAARTVAVVIPPEATAPSKSEQAA